MREIWYHTIRTSTSLNDVSMDRCKPDHKISTSQADSSGCIPRVGSTTPSVLAAGLQLARVRRCHYRQNLALVGGLLGGTTKVIARSTLCSEVSSASSHRSPIHPVETVLTAYLQRFFKEAWVSSQLSHPNIVPFLGVYSTPSHPFALIYAVMDNHDLGLYLAGHLNVSRLRLEDLMLEA